MKSVIATAMGFYKGSRIRAGQSFTVADDVTGKWFVDAAGYKAPPVPTEGPTTFSEINRAKALPAPATFNAPAPAAESLEDMKATELIAFAAKNGLEIGDLVPQSGKEKILTAVKAAIARMAPAVPSAN